MVTFYLLVCLALANTEIDILNGQKEIEQIKVNVRQVQKHWCSNSGEISLSQILTALQSMGKPREKSSQITLRSSF